MTEEKKEGLEKIRVLVVDDIQQTRTDIRRLLYFEDDMDVCGEAQNGREALDCIAECSPDVVLMDINMPVLDGISATEALSRSHPQIAVVIISIQGEQEYLRKAMVAGASDYLVKPLSSEDMASTIRQVYRMSKDRNVIMPPLGEKATAGQNGRPADLFRVISLFGGKGGSGKSILAANLAVALAKQKLKVALIDLDLQFGDIAVMFNLSGSNTIANLTGEEEISGELLEGILIRHLSGVSVLAAPASPPEAEKIGVEQVAQVIELLKNLYDCIVVDTSAYFGDITLLALEASDLILMPVRRDIATIKNTRVGLDVLNSLELGEKVRVILNQANLNPEIELPELERSLNSKICHSVASDENAVITSINRGVPLVMDMGSSEISKDLCRLAKKVSSGFKDGEKEPARRVSLGRILSLNF